MSGAKQIDWQYLDRPSAGELKVGDLVSAEAGHRQWGWGGHRGLRSVPARQIAGPSPDRFSALRGGGGVRVGGVSSVYLPTRVTRMVSVSSDSLAGWGGGGLCVCVAEPAGGRVRTGSGSSHRFGGSGRSARLSGVGKGAVCEERPRFGAGAHTRPTSFVDLPAPKGVSRT